jgi:hypothetical protein
MTAPATSVSTGQPPAPDRQRATARGDPRHSRPRRRSPRHHDHPGRDDLSLASAPAHAPCLDFERA